MADPRAEPSARALGESLAALAAQVPPFAARWHRQTNASTEPGYTATWISPPVSRNSPKSLPTRWTPPRPVDPQPLPGLA